MPNLIRFGVSLEKVLLDRFDRLIREKRCPSRSEALRDLIREELVKKEWRAGQEVAGAVILVYNHHRRQLVDKLTDIQHDYHRFIVSSQHVHLSDDDCLEIIAVKGEVSKIRALADRMRAAKGVKYGTVALATTGRNLT